MRTKIGVSPRSVNLERDEVPPPDRSKNKRVVHQHPRACEGLGTLISLFGASI